MSTVELRNQLIVKIQNTNDDYLLEEVYRLLEMEPENMEVYKLSNEQKTAIAEARQQIMDGQSLTDDQANKEIDQWLNK